MRREWTAKSPARRRLRKLLEKKRTTSLHVERLELRLALSVSVASVHKVTAPPPPTGEFANSVIAYSSQYTSTNWSARQTLGAPNVSYYGDSPQSWSPSKMNAGTEFITVGYATPINATTVNVYENFGNGFVSKIEVRNASTKAFETVWSGNDPTAQGTIGKFSAVFTQRSYLVNAVRVTIDTSRSPNWEDIDAIELRSDGTPSNNAAPTVATAAAATDPGSGTTTTLSVLGADDGGEANLKYTWAATTLLSGASAPTFSANGTNAAKNTTATFSAAGTYTFTATLTDAGGLSTTSKVNVTVDQSLTSVVVTPSTPTVAINSTTQFAASGRDQFGNAMASQPGFDWSATAGTITTAGLFTAPDSATTATVTATVTGGTLSASAQVNVVVPGFLNLQTPALSALVQTLDADGSFSRADMIQVFTTVEAAGTVTAGEFSDLKTILSNAATLNMPGYVQVLASDVVLGNVANAHYQGTTLGNLKAGSTVTQLTELVGKWFLGTDHPKANANGSYGYASVAGTLFVNGPNYTDVRQGEDGDCYMIASMGALALSNPNAITNMIVDNGDNTYTVRFYANGKADYVTVDRMLPVSGGHLIYDGMGLSATSSTNELWLPLVEKAYAQWNETGKEGRDGTNTYAGIEGGWMADVLTQALGYNATSIFTLNATAKQTVINDLATHKAVTIATTSAGGNGLYGDHAYTIVSYNATAGTFTLYNPWGSNQPGPLTWAQLQADCDGLATADPSNTVPISGATTSPPVKPVAPAPDVPDDSGDRSAMTDVSDAASSQTIIVQLDGGSSTVATPEQRTASSPEPLLSNAASSSSAETHAAVFASAGDLFSKLLSSTARPQRTSLDVTNAALDEVFASDSMI